MGKALLCGLSRHPGSRLGQSSGEQPFSFDPLAKVGATTQRSLLYVWGRNGQGGQGPSASPTQPLRRGCPFPSGTLCQKRKTPAPVTRSLILKVSQPLAFSAFPLCYSREGHSSVCGSVSDRTAQAHAHRPWVCPHWVQDLAGSRVRPRWAGRQPEAQGPLLGNRCLALMAQTKP